MTNKINFFIEIFSGNFKGPSRFVFYTFKGYFYYRRINNMQNFRLCRPWPYDVHVWNFVFLEETLSLIKTYKNSWTLISNPAQPKED